MTDAPSAGKPRLTGPKQQHYLPECYLKGFARNGGVAVLDRRTGEVRRQSTSATAKIGHFYTFEDSEGRKRYDLEHLFAQIESGFAAAVSKVNREIGLSAKDLEYLISFIALAELRTPAAIEDAKLLKAGFLRTLAHATTGSLDLAYSALRKMYSDKGERVPERELRQRARDMVRFVRSGRYEIVVDAKAALKDSIRRWVPLQDELWQKDVEIVRAEEGANYITCDSPVYLGTTSGKRVGFGSTDALVLFPLSSRLLVALSGKNQRFGLARASAKQVAKANFAIARNSMQYLFGPEEEELRALSGAMDLVGTQAEPRHETGMIELAGRTIWYVERRVPSRRDEREG